MEREIDDRREGRLRVGRRGRRGSEGASQNKGGEEKAKDGWWEDEGEV